MICSIPSRSPSSRKTSRLRPSGAGGAEVVDQLLVALDAGVDEDQLGAALDRGHLGRSRGIGIELKLDGARAGVRFEHRLMERIWIGSDREGREQDAGLEGLELRATRGSFRNLLLLAALVAGHGHFLA